ncbi:unnamed protein product, partial [Meganyctiphanes norvegica]
MPTLTWGASLMLGPVHCCQREPAIFVIVDTCWCHSVFLIRDFCLSFYNQIINTLLNNIEYLLKHRFYLIVYHILLFMFMWAYWQTIFTDIGHVPKQFKLPPSELDRYESAETDEIRRDTLERFTQKQNLPVFNRTMTGDIRYCDKCCTVKPDRCHHCSVCGECVLKMDHHCPWVNNCVAFTNYKYFVLFLGYALVYCLWIAATTLRYFISFWRNQLEGSAGKFHILFVFFVSIMFAISLVSLFGYHIFLVLKNRSTLESFRAPIFRLAHTWVQDKEGFSLGAYNNFQEIFGDNRKTWFLPIPTSLGDGVAFPVKNSVGNVGNVGNQQLTNTNTTTTTTNTTNTTSPTTVQSYGSTNTSLGDGVTYPQRCVDEDTDGLLGQRQSWRDDDEEDDHLQRFSTGFINANSHHNLEEVVVQGNNTHAV